MGMLEKMKNYMGNNNNEQGQKEKNKFTEMLKKIVKKIAKELLKFIITHLWILIPIFIALIVIVVIFMGLTNKSAESSAKAGEVIKEKTRFENGQIIIDEDLYDEIRRTLRENGVDPDSIYLGKDYQYLEKMVQATIVTNYPDTSGRVYSIGEVTNMSDQELWIAATDGQLTSRPSSSDTPANGEAIQDAVAKNLISVTVPVWIWESPGTNNMKRVATTMTQPINAAVAPIYTAFFEELFASGSETSGFVIDKTHTGTGAPRAPTGSVGWASMHVYGAAVDINYGTSYNGDLTNGYWGWGNRGVYSESEWRAMPEIQAKYETIYTGSIPAQLAEKYDMAWGGTWGDHDMMHFSFFGEKSRSGINVGDAFTGTTAGFTGVGQIYRDRGTGSPVKLGYISEAGFDWMLERDSLDVLNYFTVDSNINVIVAKYNKTTIIDNDGNEDVSYEFSKVTIPYTSQVSQYAMPFEFLYIMLITTLNPEYVGAIADLAINQTEIHLTVMDSQYINRTETEHSYWVETTVKEDGAQVSQRDEQHNSHQTVIEEINNVAAEITHVRTWIYTKELSYETTDYPEEKIGEGTITGPENPPNPDNPGNPDYADPEPTSENTTRGEDVYELDPATNTMVKTGTRTIQIETITRIHDIQDYIEEYAKRTICVPSANAEKEIDCDLFLGLWSNETGKYEEGALYVPYQEGGEVVTYRIPDTGLWNSPAVTICEYPTLFFYQLAATEKTQSYENLMKYILYVYTGIDYGITDPNDLLDLFRDRLTSVGYGSNILLEFIKSWENSAIWNYERDGTYTRGSRYSTDRYLTEDGQYYLVYEDGSRGHNNIAYGLATFITNSGHVRDVHPTYGGGYYNHEDGLNSRGISVRSLHTGSQVPVDQVNEYYAEYVQGRLSAVESKVGGLDLTTQQIHALVSVMYQYGNIGNFVEAYTQHGNTEALKTAFTTSTRSTPI